MYPSPSTAVARALSSAARIGSLRFERAGAALTHCRCEAGLKADGGKRSSSTSSLSSSPKKRLVLGIESSFDDTSVSIVREDRAVLSNVVSSQRGEEFGGLVPTVASKRHIEAFPEVVGSSLREAGVSLYDIDAVAVTRGPGMAFCLSIGLCIARLLAAVAQKPLYGIHHMEAHALTPRLTQTPMPQFPYLTLLISGGHTMMVLVKGVGSHRILGTTLDDAVGEAFDKVSRLLRIPQGRYPSPGAALEAAAERGEIGGSGYMFPVPLRTSRALDFSFSGLKTAVLRGVEGSGVFGVGVSLSNASFQIKAAQDNLASRLATHRKRHQTHPTPAEPPFSSSSLSSTLPSSVSLHASASSSSSLSSPSSAHLPNSSSSPAVEAALPPDQSDFDPLKDLPQSIFDAAATFQATVVLHLTQRLRKAMKLLQAEDIAVTAIVASGGVARNQAIRDGLWQVAGENGIPLIAPPLHMCTDNAAMIAWTALERMALGEQGVASLTHTDLLPQWSLEDLKPVVR